MEKRRKKTKKKKEKTESTDVRALAAVAAWVGDFVQAVVEGAHFDVQDMRVHHHQAVQHGNLLGGMVQ